MTHREVILREMGLTPIWVNRPSVPQPDPVDLPALVTPLVASQHAASAPAQSLADREAAIANMSWDEITASIAACTACKLCMTRKNTVPGAGDRSPAWMIVGEAPGEIEDQLGEPFVGKAGQLLDAMLVAVGKKRGEGVYIVNVIKCHPPENRNPEPDEITACSPYLSRQITLAKPKLLLAAGDIAAQTLLNREDTVAAMRALPETGSQRDGTPVVVTCHPSHLLRSPIEKAKAWDDLMKAKALAP